MKATTTVALALLAGTALAAPAELQAKLKARRAERRAERMAKRQADRALGKTVRPLAVNKSSMTDYVTLGGNDSDETEYSENWSGAIIVTTGVKEVTGTFTIPSVTEPSGGNSNEEYGASIWVGIDGDTCDTAILQTGIDLLVEGSETAYSGWYEWYPDYAYSFSDFEVSAGDEITATVTATSVSGGTAVLDNKTTGKSVTKVFTDMGDVGKLCEYDAEWIVEDFEDGDSLIPFADFGTVTFTDASYKTSDGTYGVEDATVIDIEQDNKVLTSCSIDGDSELICKYE